MHLMIEGMVISAAASVAMSSIVLGVFSRESAPRYTGAFGFAAGLFGAFAHLELRQHNPTAHWYWIPWLVLAAAVIGPVSIASGIGWLERLTLGAVFALAAGWFLVPMQKALLPLRTTYIVAFAGIVALYWNLLDRLTRRESGIPLWSALAFTTLNSAALVTYTSSERVGFLCAAGAAALTGGGLSAVWKRKFTIVRGMLAASCVCLCGILLITRLNDALTYVTVALILLSPLNLWLFEFGPLSRLHGLRSHLSRTACVVVPHVAAWCLSWTGLPT